MTKRLPAEWEEQRFVQLTWPHVNTDWAPYLKDARRCYKRIAEEILKREDLMVVSDEAIESNGLVEAILSIEGIETIKTIESKKTIESIDSIESIESIESIKSIESKNSKNSNNSKSSNNSKTSSSSRTSQFSIISAPSNDTWARDHAFITTEEDGCLLLNDFCFNGWGMKFAANLDNQINQTIFPKFQELETAESRQLSYRNCLNTVLEGGSIESDGRGTILTTTECLLSKNRNNFQSKEEAEDMLRKHFGATHILWLDHGYLAGDDTDSHIDTLARLCPNDTIVYVKCEDQSDEHFAELKAMEEELKAFRTQDSKPFTLLPLPLPAAVYEPSALDGGESSALDDVQTALDGGDSSALDDVQTALDDGDSSALDGGEHSIKSSYRLPATYANFLIINGAVLVPTYNQPDNDSRAIAVVQQAFPDREIVGIDSQVLIRQHGSIHCVTMQYPK